MPVAAVISINGARCPSKGSFFGVQIPLYKWWSRDRAVILCLPNHLYMQIVLNGLPWRGVSRWTLPLATTAKLHVLGRYSSAEKVA